MKEIRFTKMHGISNDYIYINCMSSLPDNLSDLSIEMSNRHTGVGGDGIILICPSQVADFKMRIFNADGSEAEMCGNGSRCVGKYVYDNGLTDKTDITLETLAGIKELHLNVVDGYVSTVRVNMGHPILKASLIPHGVIFSDDIDKLNIAGIGRELETHPIWPERANIEFVKVMSRREIAMRVWERGSGETMACGTGACAAAVASVLTGRTDRKVTVHLKGGDLSIEWDSADNNVYMTGPAETVFIGKYYLKI